MSQQLPLIDPKNLGMFIFEEDKNFEFYPTNKPPVCFRGFKVHTFSDLTDIYDSNLEPFDYEMFITNGGSLIMKYAHEHNGICIDDPDASPVEVKIKRFANLNDVWTFFKEIDRRYIDFLAVCAKKLENPTLFWLKVE